MKLFELIAHRCMDQFSITNLVALPNCTLYFLSMDLIYISKVLLTLRLSLSILKNSTLKLDK